MYSVMWSEHCSYKSSRAHLSRFPTSAPWVLVGPGEGAGVVDIGDGIAIAVRIESHNHPSAVEPYQGAATGVGGIIRDVFSIGARPIALMDALRFGSLDDARTRYLFEGVVSGISGYGNSVGVPTVGGEVVFDDTYRGNPLVNVFCLGILPKERLVLARAEGPGNLAVLLGSSTGRDGIGGASVLASASFAEGDDAKRPAVQVGDPFEEKRLIEACLELLDAGLAVGVQDLGAAGLSCAASETAAKAGAGMDVDVARVAKREPGMNPVETMTSESQERMLAIVEPGKLDAVLALARRWEIRATVVGRVTDTARFRVYEGLFDAVGVPGENPPGAVGRRRARGVVGRAADRRRARRELGRRAALPSARGTPAGAGRAPGGRSARTAARQVPGRHGFVGRAARVARRTHHRGQDLGVAAVRPSTLLAHGRRSGRRRSRAANQGLGKGTRARDRRQGALLPARPAHRRSSGRLRSGPQCRVRWSAADRARQLSELRQPRAPGSDVAVHRGRGGDERGLRGARHPGHRRQCQLLQHLQRRGHRPDPGRRGARPHRRAPGATPGRRVARGRGRHRDRRGASRARRLGMGGGGARARRRHAAGRGPRRRAGDPRAGRRPGARPGRRRCARRQRRRPRGRARRDGDQRRCRRAASTSRSRAARPRRPASRSRRRSWCAAPIPRIPPRCSGGPPPRASRYAWSGRRAATASSQRRPSTSRSPPPPTCGATPSPTCCNRSDPSDWTRSPPQAGCASNHRAFSTRGVAARGRRRPRPRTLGASCPWCRCGARDRPVLRKDPTRR